jgi:hypothetical protein
MLRDWKLAQSTYDLIRSDFSDAKAWKYYAAANEMAAISLLIAPQDLPSKSRAEAVDSMLENAFYSYQTRCNSPFGALRSLTLGVELLRLRGGSCVDVAARWGIRLLDSKIPSSVGDALMKERLAVCYASKEGVGSLGWGSRKRKSAVWSVFGAEAWIGQAKYVQAQRCLNEARKLYSGLSHGNGISLFPAANDMILGLQRHLDEKLGISLEEGEENNEGGDWEAMDEERQSLNSRSRRASMMGPTGALLETAPLRRDNPLPEIPISHIASDPEVDS